MFRRCARCGRYACGCDKRRPARTADTTDTDLINPSSPLYQAVYGDSDSSGSGSSCSGSDSGASSGGDCG